MIRSKRIAALGPGRIVGAKPIDVVDSRVGAADSGAASFNIAAYSGVQEDDLIVVMAQAHITGRTLTPSAAGLSFTPVVNGDVNSWSQALSYAWSPDSTSRTVAVGIAGGNTSGKGALVIFRGVSRDNPFDVAAAIASVASTTTPTVDGITTVASLSKVVVFYGVGTASVPAVAEAGWSDLVSQTSNNRAIRVAHSSDPEKYVAPGATGGIEFTLASAATGGSIRFALRRSGM